jgi:predicted esterase
MLPEIARAGVPLETAHTAVVLVHGRGASATSMLGLAGELAPRGSPASQQVAFLAPQASGHIWYPHSFLAPIALNEPHLSMALSALSELLAMLGKSGLPPERVLLLGFSQGACLTLEFVARNARLYGGVAGLSGGLIGPPGSQHNHPGDFAGTPIFMGCSDVDPHIPLARVQETAQVLERMGANVTARLYRGLGHTVNEDEVEFVRGMIENLPR